jgi:hypothetical protein
MTQTRRQADEPASRQGDESTAGDLRRRRRTQTTMTRRVALLAVLLVPFTVEPTEGSPLSRSLTRDAYALAWDLDFVACYETLERAAAADPLDPAPPKPSARCTEARSKAGCSGRSAGAVGPSAP